MESWFSSPAVLGRKVHDPKTNCKSMPGPPRDKRDTSSLTSSDNSVTNKPNGHVFGLKPEHAHGGEQSISM